MSNPPRPDGRIRALYAAAAAGLDVATFVVQAIWLMCVVGLIFCIVALVGGIFHLF